MTQAAEWQSGVGDAWAAEWRRTDRSFASLAPHLDAAILAVSPEQGRAVDIGCGAGATSIALASARPRLNVVGVDLSPNLIAVANERGAALANLSFESAPAQDAAERHAPVDLFCSRHGVMFFDDPVAALAALRTAAAPDGRLVFSCFRAPADNPWAGEIAVAILGAPPPRPTGYQPSPFAFADPGFVTDTLAAAGWTAAAPQPVDFTYRAGAGEDPIGDALDFFQRIGPAAPALRAAAPDERPAMLDRLRAAITRRAIADAVDYPAAAWIWTAHASRRPA